MADPRGRKRKREQAEEFLHIRAKGQVLKVPKSLEGDEREVYKAKGKKTRKIPNRRDRRRQARAQKKARRVAFFTRNKEQVPKVLNGVLGKRQLETNSHATRKLEDDKLAKLETKKTKQRRAKYKSPKTQNLSKQKLLADNMKEDREIKKLEKLLKLSSKGKALTNSFKMEGLDFLLEVCEPQMTENSTSKSEFKPQPNKKVCQSKAEERDRNLDRSDEQGMRDSEQEDDDVDDDDDDDDYNDNDDEEEEEDDDDNKNANDNDNDNSGNKDERVLYYNDANDNKQDHHKNMNDNDHPNNGKDPSGNMQKYAPPHLRKQKPCESQSEHLNRITSQMKGLLNRLSEGNMSVISNEIENIYIHNSRNDINKILSNLILESCVSTSLMPEKLLMENAMLLAILSSNIGNEIAAFFVERLAELFDHLHKCSSDNHTQGKKCVNVVALFAHLYTFKIIHCCLIYDIIRRLADSFMEQDVELLLFLLKTTGAEIRRDDPASLKDIILQIQTKAASTSKLTYDSRVRFMLEIITSLRSNNLRKIPGYDPSKVEHLRKSLLSITRDSGHKASNQLKISLDELLKAEFKGRWWIVGSALGTHQNESLKMSSAQMESSKLLELARKQRMNTDVRKNVFLIIMTSEDYIDAFEKLTRLNLKDVQTREVVHVLIDCCVQERAYNPYYAYLGQKFCEYSRSYQVTFQYSFWDKFKVVANMASHSAVNLSRLMSHLIATKALSLAVLKVVNFVELDKPSVNFFTHLFRHLLTGYSTETTRNVFERISAVKELSTLCQSLRIFINHFVGKTASNNKTERLSLVDGILGAYDTTKL